jgi:DNA repair exonuclease SbcCD ATPase subunit
MEGETSRKLNSLLSDLRTARKTRQREEDCLQEAREKFSAAEEARSIVQSVAEAVQRESHKKVSEIVTHCLKAVFGDDAYEFEIHFEQKRGKTEASLVFVRDGLELDPATACGGGVLDLAAFALRLACLVLSRPQRRKFLALDENFKHMSREYIPAVKELLLSLARSYSLQIILITHNPDLVCGKVVEL